MLSPKVHNFISYLGAAVVFVVALPSSVDVITSVGSIMWLAHFIRRALESILVFRFSGLSVSIGDSITEYVYYWGFAAWLARTAPLWANVDTTMMMIGGIVWILSEYCNFSCHVTLATVPKTSKRARVAEGAPYLLFASITSPHYFFEMMSWIGFNISTGFTLPGVLFNSLGSIIMTCYAVQRHSKLPPSTAHTPVFPFGIDIRPPQAIVDAI